MTNDRPGTLFEASKNGRIIEFDRDPAPDTSQYFAIDGGGFLVMFPKDGTPRLPPTNADQEDLPLPNRDEHLRGAFTAIAGRVRSSQWTASSAPFTELLTSLKALAQQQEVAEDVAAHLGSDPSVENAIEMLYTSISMSARAKWDLAPASIRGVVARGWFLGRWLPTFLVLDGPILRFLRSPAFRRQASPVPLLRSVRSFFDTPDFMALRHAFAHWSFAWQVENGDSVVIGAAGSSETVRVTRAEADAFHIITFAVIEAIDEAFVRPGRLQHTQAAIMQSEQGD